MNASWYSALCFVVSTLLACESAGPIDVRSTAEGHSSVGGVGGVGGVDGAVEQGSDASEAVTPATSCGGDVARLPSACGSLAEVASGCDLEMPPCELDVDCSQRECRLWCLRIGPLCDDLVAYRDGDESRLGSCFEQCATTVFCGGEYLSAEQFCDGVPDCASGEDERVQTSADGSMTCQIPLYRHAFCSGAGPLDRLEICDGTEQCRDGSDESDANCALGVGYRCRGVEQRVARRSVCDGVPDCPEGDDEPCSAPVPACPEVDPTVDAWLDGDTLCAIAKLGPREPRGLSVSVSVGECANGDPFFPRQVCDGALDCADGADEVGCPIVCDGGVCRFPCASGDLVSLDALCDGVADCPGADDEPCTGELRCGGERLSYDLVCDGIPDCADGEDELGCPAPHFVCADGEQIVYPFVRFSHVDSLCTLPLCNDQSDVTCINPP